MKRHPAQRLRNNMIKLDTKLNLETAEDRRILRDILASEPNTAELADVVDEYLRFFRASEWRQVYGGGMVGGPNGSDLHELERLLQKTKSLRLLESYAGFSAVVGALSNPPQVSSTLFEIDTAAWCVTRAMHLALEFSPPVERNAKMKRPEFRWSTQRGDLWCECKCGQIQNSRTWAKIQTIVESLEEHVARARVPDDCRVEVRFPSYAHAHLVIETVGRMFHDTSSPDQSDSRMRNISVPVVPKASAFTRGPDTMFGGVMRVGTTPVQIDPATGPYVVVADLAKASARTTRTLIRKAREQLPRDAPSAIFLGGVGRAAPLPVIQTEVASPNNVVFCGLWPSAFDPNPEIVWRVGQPFDAALTVSADTVMHLNNLISRLRRAGHDATQLGEQVETLLQKILKSPNAPPKSSSCS